MKKFFYLIFFLFLFLSFQWGIKNTFAEENTESDFTTELNEDGTITITDYKNEDIKDVKIPETIDGKKVTRIGGSAFDRQGLTSVKIPSSVTSIGWYAFSNNSLTNVEIPEGVTTIGVEAFSFNNLTSVTIPSSVESIGEYAFANNYLKKVTFKGAIQIVSHSFDSQYPLPNFLDWYTDESYTEDKK